MTGPLVADGDGVTLGVLVNVDVEINVEVNDGVSEGVAVREGVKVELAVFVIGWNNVGDGLAVIVGDGVEVGVAVCVTVPVMTDGKGVTVGLWNTLVGVTILDVEVGVCVSGFESGARINASHPMQ
jgi:hypothetical protein